MDIERMLREAVDIFNGYETPSKKETPREPPKPERDILSLFLNKKALHFIKPKVAKVVVEQPEVYLNFVEDAYTLDIFDAPELFGYNVRRVLFQQVEQVDVFDSDSQDAELFDQVSQMTAAVARLLEVGRFYEFTMKHVTLRNNVYLNCEAPRLEALLKPTCAADGSVSWKGTIVEELDRLEDDLNCYSHLSQDKRIRLYQARGEILSAFEEEVAGPFSYAESLLRYDRAYHQVVRSCKGKFSYHTFRQYVLLFKATDPSPSEEYIDRPIEYSAKQRLNQYCVGIGFKPEYQYDKVGDMFRCGLLYPIEENDQKKKRLYFSLAKTKQQAGEDVANQILQVIGSGGKFGAVGSMLPPNDHILKFHDRAVLASDGLSAPVAKYLFQTQPEHVLSIFPYFEPVLKNGMLGFRIVHNTMLTHELLLCAMTRDSLFIGEKWERVVKAFDYQKKDYLRYLVLLYFDFLPQILFYLQHALSWTLEMNGVEDMMFQEMNNYKNVENLFLRSAKPSYVQSLARHQVQPEFFSPWPSFKGIRVWVSGPLNTDFLTSREYENIPLRTVCDLPSSQLSQNDVLLYVQEKHDQNLLEIACAFLDPFSYVCYGTRMSHSLVKTLMTFIEKGLTVTPLASPTNEFQFVFFKIWKPKMVFLQSAKDRLQGRNPDILKVVTKAGLVPTPRSTEILRRFIKSVGASQIIGYLSMAQIVAEDFASYEKVLLNDALFMNTCIGRIKTMKPPDIVPKKSSP